MTLSPGNTASNSTTKRISHLDALRGFAILMMLQGHFIDSLLNPIYRNPENPIYQAWLFARGFTAPLFFTITGIVLTYLLLQCRDKKKLNTRINKTALRGIDLLFIGYLLGINPYNLLLLRPNSGLYHVDVLQCIAIALFAIILLYQLFKRIPRSLLATVLLFCCCGIFLIEPLINGLQNISSNKLFLSWTSYTTGSNFIPIPWIGYSLFGSFLAVLYSKYYHSNKNKLLLILFALGLFFLYSSELLMTLNFLFDIELFKEVAYNNYLFLRLAHSIFIIIGFYLLESIFTKTKLLLAIGKNTLEVYIVHHIILYGINLHLGLIVFFEQSLSPTIAAIGATVFVLACSFLGLQFKFPGFLQIIKDLKRKFKLNSKTV